MAKANNKKLNSNTKKSTKTVTKKAIKKSNEKKITIVKKILVFLGVILLFFAILYLMHFFFVKNSNLNINMSTDKKFDYINLADEKKQITTQKYVSDLGYSMRYDINEFKVLKYKTKDIFKYKKDDKTAIILEVVNSFDDSCVPSSANTIYNNCYIKIDSFTEEYYMSSGNKIYKMIIKNPGNNKYDDVSRSEINYMMQNFVIG